MAESIQKVIKVTLDATKTVVVACSATTIDTTNDTILSDGHGFKTGDVVDATTSVTLPTGLAVNTAYYVRTLSHDKFYLYDTYAHAIALTATTGIINLSATGSGNLTLRQNAYGVVHLGEKLPVGSIVRACWTKYTTTFSGTTTAAIGNGTNTFVAAAALATIAATPTYSCTLDPTTGCVITANDELIATLASGTALTDGKCDIYIEYVY